MNLSKQIGKKLNVRMKKGKSEQIKAEINSVIYFRLVSVSFQEC